MLLYDLLHHESGARKDAMTAARIDGLIARGEKDGHLREQVRQIEAVALEPLPLERELQELHERAARLGS